MRLLELFNSHPGDDTDECLVLLKLDPIQLFCKHVSWVGMSVDVLNGNFALEDPFLNKVVFSFNVLGLGMENWIFCQLHGALIITIQV